MALRWQLVLLCTAFLFFLCLLLSTHQYVLDLIRHFVQDFITDLVSLWLLGLKLHDNIDELHKYLSVFTYRNGVYWVCDHLFLSFYSFLKLDLIFCQVRGGNLWGLITLSMVRLLEVLMTFLFFDPIYVLKTSRYWKTTGILRLLLLQRFLFKAFLNLLRI